MYTVWIIDERDAFIPAYEIVIMEMTDNGARYLMSRNDIVFG